MKLFKSLLVAPAALGLLAPIAASANEVNLNDISNYSDQEIEVSSNTFKPLSTENPLLAGGEGLYDGLDHDGSFSTTTTASFSADFAIGAVDGGTSTSDDAVNAGYGFQIDLNTSFTGEDSLDVSIDAGTASANGYAELDLNDASETLKVDGISYTFPVGGITVLVGDTVDGSVFFDYACAYDTPSDTMDDCGAPNSAFVGSGTTLAASYDFDNGWYASAGYASTGDAQAGIATAESTDAWGANVSYTGDNYKVSASYAMVEDASFFADNHFALNAYFQPEGFPTISAGYEWGNDVGEASTGDELTSYFVGVQFEEVGPGTLGVAMGTKAATVEGNDDLIMYEAFYSYDVNDGMTITPLIFIKEFASGTDDETGAMVKTSFSF